MSVTGSDVFYLLVCRQCGDLELGPSGEVVSDNALFMLFDTAEARGKWATAHTRGTGHDHWFVFDQPREA
jgi:hypothetical protein